MQSETLILYHANCADGFCSAWVAHMRFGDKAEYRPVQYGETPPEVADRNVYLLDFSYKRPVMDEMRQRALTLTVLDHHKTAQVELEGFGRSGPNEETNVRCVFDMEKSGGRLTWEHFFPGKYAPWLVNYTEDRDLWRWKLSRSKEISAFVASHPHDFKLWSNWNTIPMTSGCWADFAEQGAAILRYQSQLVDSLCATAREVEIDGHKVLAANVSCLFSEVAGKLAEGRPFGAAWFIRSDGVKQWSLRSRESGVDVSEVAKRHGGGGHRNAAGFEGE